MNKMILEIKMKPSSRLLNQGINEPKIQQRQLKILLLFGIFPPQSKFMGFHLPSPLALFACRGVFPGLPRWVLMV